MCWEILNAGTAQTVVRKRAYTQGERKGRKECSTEQEEGLED
jgi:hypothetical protein